MKYKILITLFFIGVISVSGCSEKIQKSDEIKCDSSNWNTLTLKSPYSDTFEIEYPTDWEKYNNILTYTKEGKIKAVLFILYQNIEPEQLPNIKDRSLEGIFKEYEEDGDLNFGSCENKTYTTLGGEAAIKCNWVKDKSNEELKKTIAYYLEYYAPEKVEEFRNIEKFDYSYIVSIHDTSEGKISTYLLYLLDSSSNNKEEHYCNFEEMISSLKFIENLNDTSSIDPEAQAKQKNAIVSIEETQQKIIENSEYIYN